MLAVHLENLLFLLLLVVAGLFQLLGRAARKGSTGETKRTSEPPPRMPKPIQRAPIESDEQRVRKFLEALGQPPASRPPPPVRPRADIPPRPLAPVQPPAPYPRPPWKLAREEQTKRHVILTESPAPVTAKPGEKIFRPPITGAFPSELHEESLLVERPSIIKTPSEAYVEAARPITKTEEPKSDIAILLASASGLRGAIVLREILGPPRGLRAPELL
jgi:hypothetical protein